MGHKRPKFIRPDTNRFSRLGKNRRKLHKWRRVRGKSNKLRLGRGGYSKVPAVGFKSPRIESGKINGFVPKLVHNLAELTHKHSAMILIDGCQLIQHEKIDVLPNNDPRHLDFIAFSGHKMYAPFGVGVLIGQKKFFDHFLLFFVVGCSLLSLVLRFSRKTKV